MTWIHMGPTMTVDDITVQADAGCEPMARFGYTCLNCPLPQCRHDVSATRSRSGGCEICGATARWLIRNILTGQWLRVCDSCEKKIAQRNLEQNRFIKNGGGPR